ncbi:MAG TPA: GNAT family N-acetyltransferase [Candidatus Limnocylindria bacterium]|jgi:GNAT superfamily N-acetyltransferase
MAPAKKTAEPVDPNKLVRRSAGTYRSGDERFEVRQSGLGWYLVDSTQADELGQELVLGPFPTLAAVRDAIPAARRTTVRSLPRPRKPSSKARAKADAPPEPKPKPEPEPKPVHRLLAVLLAAATDTFPPSDLEVEVLAPPTGSKADAVVAFSGHSMVVAGIDEARVRRRLPADDPAAPMSADFLVWLGKQLGSEPGTIDAVLVALPGWVSPKALTLEPVPDRQANAHDRVKRSRHYRADVAAYTDADERGIVILGRGLAGRLEVSIEVRPELRGRGIGSDLARAALKLVPEGEPLFAQVTPGNVASLRAFLAAGYRPIGSEVLFLRRRR